MVRGRDWISTPETNPKLTIILILNKFLNCHNSELSQFWIAPAEVKVGSWDYGQSWISTPKANPTSALPQIGLSISIKLLNLPADCFWSTCGERTTGAYIHLHFSIGPCHALPIPFAQNFMFTSSQFHILVHRSGHNQNKPFCWCLFF